MTRVLPLLILLAVTIFTLVTVAQSSPYSVRHLPRWLWFVIVLIVPGLGCLAWWIFGRPLPGDPEHPGAPARPIAPDDDSDFLRGL